jgi:hypothetical protein
MWSGELTGPHFPDEGKRQGRYLRRLALSLPVFGAKSDPRHQAVLIFTVVVQSLTLRPLIRRMGAGSEATVKSTKPDGAIVDLMMPVKLAIRDCV